MCGGSSCPLALTKLAPASPCSRAAQEFVSAAGKRRGWLLWLPGRTDLDLNEESTLLPDPACCAHEGLELHNLFQYRGENVSVGVGGGDYGPMGGGS